MRLALFVAAGISAVSVGLALGCSGSTKSGFQPDPVVDAGPVDTGPPQVVEDAGPLLGDGFAGDVVTPQPLVPPELYAHTDRMLYKVDPATKVATLIGTFSCSTTVVDIALDEKSNMYGTTPGSVISIDRQTAQCTVLTTGSFPNSLSFVPKGTLDPNEEALVGFEGNSYVRISPLSGNKQIIGALGQPNLRSSGDIVSVKGGGTYLTVNGQTSTGKSCNDCLVEIDPKTGAIIQNLGSVGYGSVYGIAFWAGSVYGFTSFGEFFEVAIRGSTIRTTRIQLTAAPPIAFYGAGSTTSAPVEAPR